MSGSASQGLEQAILGHTLGYAPTTAPARVYVALCHVLPPPTEGAGGNEPTSGNYIRVPASFVASAASPATATNAAAVEFPVATASWGALGYFELWSAQTGGERLYWGPLVDPSDPSTPLTINIEASDILRFPAGALAVQATDLPGTYGGAYLRTGLGGILDGRDYGIVADGVTDDTAALQAAIAAAQATVPGGQCSRLILPKGRILTGPQTITNQIFIQGTHDNSTVLVLKNGSTTGCLTINPSGGAFPGVPRGRIVLQDLRIENQTVKVGSTTAHGIELVDGGTWTAHVTLQRVTIYAMPGSGIASLSFDGWVDAYDCSIFNNLLAGVNANSCSDWHWYGGDIAVNGQQGMLLSGCSQFVVHGTNIYSNGVANLHLFTSTTIHNGWHTFTNVMFDRGNQHGVVYDLRGGVGAVFKGCTFGMNSTTSPNTYSDAYIGSEASNFAVFSGCFWGNNFAGDGSSPKWALEFQGSTNSVVVDGTNTYRGGTLRTNAIGQVRSMAPGVPFTLSATAIQNAATDAAAAGLGVPVGGVYRNGSVLMVRVA